MALDLLSRFSDTSYLSRRNLPISPDGRYDYESVQKKLTKDTSFHSSFTTFIREVSAVSGKDYPSASQAFKGFVDQKLHPTAVDDRQNFFASALGYLSGLDPALPLARALAATAVNTLYTTVPHPPASFLGHRHVFRAADGGGNCLEDPDRGRAGTSYARSVQGKLSAPLSSLPEPNLIFDALLKRRGIKPHAGGTSSFTFAFATLVTHSIFMTNLDDWSRNDTSSYLDLSPLYGHNQDAQDLVRNKSEGRGLLYPDTFSESRLRFLPPAASAILVLFARNHNYIAERLLKINERAKWEDPPPPVDDPRRTIQDEEIFQTARLINGGHFMAMIIGDYAGGFLGLGEGQFWDIPAFDEIRLPDGTKIERGRGNHVSVEFNLMYRWHATISEPDEKWTEQQLTKSFNKPFHEITLEDLQAGIKRTQAALQGPDKLPHKRTFGGLRRDEQTGRFSDDDLAKILHQATKNAGGAWRARGTPESLRIVEVLGILQAREWGVCTMNEFRQFLGLKPFDSFEEWSGDQGEGSVADAARNLYGHIDNLELYPGLQAEATMPLSPGSRIAAGYTTVRAVLGDAIAMVRGDRYYTTDFTPTNLTAWGFEDCQRDRNNGGLGGAMPKLLMRHLPRHYPPNNVYGAFPYFTPDHMLESLTKRKCETPYLFDYPPEGASASPPQVISTRSGILTITGNVVGVMTSAETTVLSGGFGFGGPPVVKKAGRVWRRSVVRSSVVGTRRDASNTWALRAMFPDDRALPNYRAWFRRTFDRIIKERAWGIDGVPGKYVDITGVIIDTSIEWACEHLCGISPKTKENPRGIYTVQEVYDRFSLLFKAIFLSEREPEHTFSVRLRADHAREELMKLIAPAVAEAQPDIGPRIVSNLVNTISNLLWRTPRRSSQDILELLLAGVEDPDPLDKVTAAVLGMAVCSSMNVILAAVPTIDFYLDETRRKEMLRIVNDDYIAQREEQVLGYVREAMRLNPAVSGLYVNVPSDVEIPAGVSTQAMTIKQGERVWLSYKNAHIHPDSFPDPLVVNPMRPKEDYLWTPTFFMGCPGADFVEQIVGDIVKAVFSRPDIRRAPGYQGKLVGITTEANQTVENWYITPSGAADAFPGSLQLVYGS